MGKTYNKMTKYDFLSICNKYAVDKGGKCLSKEYVSIHSKLLWECEFGHIWRASPANIKCGKWCPVCSQNKKLTLQDCIYFAKSKDGYCRSTKYVNSATALKWECKFGHIWKANFNNVKSKNSWCPICNTHVGENICRLFFEQFFKKPFSKAKPKWLRKKSGSLLELDGFNSELKIAFEYQGIQHYEIDGFFIKTQKQLDKRKEDDLLKQKLCSENNVLLILIPYFNNHVNLKSITDIINNILIEYGFIPRDIFLDLTKLYSDKIQKYKELAKNRDGECLSNIYINYNTKLIWKCKNGHIWTAIGYSIERGHWCPDCAGNRKKLPIV